MTPNNDKLETEKLRKFLIRRFALVIVVTSLVEFLEINLLNYFVFPLIQHGFWGDTQWENMSPSTMVWFVFVTFLELLVIAIGSVMPGFFQKALNGMVLQIEGRIYQNIPELQGTALTQLSNAEGFLLFIISLFLIFLLLLPMGVAAGVFAGIITREVKRIEWARERQHYEYDRQRNLMLSDIAHDLRTPITTVSGYAKALADGMVKDPEKQQEYLEAIQNKSARMEELIQLLFEYSKLGSAGFQLKRECTDLAELMRENAAVIYADVEDAGMELDIDIPETKCMVNVDKVQFSRVIANLITNAIRHNEPGCHILLSLREIEDEDCYGVAVADNGKQIPPEVAAKLFQPFAVGDESRSTRGGSGLGLSIAHKIVEMHGSELTLVDNYLEYTKAFYMELRQI